MSQTPASQTPAQSVIDLTNSPVDLTNSPARNTSHPVRSYYNDARDDDVTTTVTSVVTTVVKYTGVPPVPPHVARTQARLLAAHQPRGPQSGSSSFAPVAVVAPAPTPVPVLAPAAAPVVAALRVGERNRCPRDFYPNPPGDLRIKCWYCDTPLGGLKWHTQDQVWRYECWCGDTVTYAYAFANQQMFPRNSW